MYGRRVSNSLGTPCAVTSAPVMSCASSTTVMATRRMCVVPYVFDSPSSSPPSLPRLCSPTDQGLKYLTYALSQHSTKSCATYEMAHTLNCEITCPTKNLAAKTPAHPAGVVGSSIARVAGPSRHTLPAAKNSM